MTETLATKSKPIAKRKSTVGRLFVFELSGGILLGRSLSANVCRIKTEGE